MSLVLLSQIAAGVARHDKGKLIAVVFFTYPTHVNRVKIEDVDELRQLLNGDHSFEIRSHSVDFCWHIVFDLVIN